MNVTLYVRTFNFHKVVHQQNSGAVEDFVLPYSAVYLRIQKWKNYRNRSTFAKVIVKIKVAPFLMAHGVDTLGAPSSYSLGLPLPAQPSSLVSDWILHASFWSCFPPAPTFGQQLSTLHPTLPAQHVGYTTVGLFSVACWSDCLELTAQRHAGSGMFCGQSLRKKQC